MTTLSFIGYDDVSSLETECEYMDVEHRDGTAFDTRWLGPAESLAQRTFDLYD